MTTTNFSLCIFCLCLLTSCSKGEKKTNELVRVKVAEVEILVPSAEREFSFIAKPFKETELSFRVDRLTVSKCMRVITIIGEIS